MHRAHMGSEYDVHTISEGSQETLETVDTSGIEYRQNMSSEMIDLLTCKCGSPVVLPLADDAQAFTL